MKDFLLSTLESLFETCFEVSISCFYLSKIRLFYKQTEKSLLFNWELPFNTVVFLSDDAFNRQLVAESLFVSSWTVVSKAFRIWFFFLYICLIRELYLLFILFSPVFSLLSSIPLINFARFSVKTLFPCPICSLFRNFSNPTMRVSGYQY